MSPSEMNLLLEAQKLLPGFVINISYDRDYMTSEGVYGLHASKHGVSRETFMRLNIWEDWTPEKILERLRRSLEVLVASFPPTLRPIKHVKGPHAVGDNYYSPEVSA